MGGIRTLVTTGTDGQVRLWDVATRRPIGSALPGPDNVNAVAFFSPEREVRLRGVRERPRLPLGRPALVLGPPGVRGRGPATQPRRMGGRAARPPLRARVLRNEPTPMSTDTGTIEPGRRGILRRGTALTKRRARRPARRRRARRRRPDRRGSTRTRFHMDAVLAVAVRRRPQRTSSRCPSRSVTGSCSRARTRSRSCQAPTASNA
jgi:hypothetical protein